MSCVKSVNPFAKSIYFFAYSFHMPAFIFLTGYLSQSCKNNWHKMIHKLYVFSAIYVVYQVVFDCIQRYGTSADMTPLLMWSPRIGLWYLLVLIIWLPIVYFTRKVPPQYMLVFSILGGFMIGLFDGAGKEWALQRLFVFFPFYYLGIVFPKNYMERWLFFKDTDRKKSRIVYWGAVAVLCGWILFCLVEASTLGYKVFLGNTSYDIMGISVVRGILYRGLWYILASIMTVVIFILVPKFQLCISYLGECTLQIFILHSIICRVWFIEGSIRNLWSKTNIFIVILVSFGLIFILGIKTLTMLVDWPEKLLYTIKQKEN